MYSTNWESVGKPMTENELLSNWHMKDIVNLKMNVNKYRKGVHRSMKIHKDILDISIEGMVYKHKRDQYISKSIEDAYNAVCDGKTLPKTAVDPVNKNKSS